MTSCVNRSSEIAVLSCARAGAANVAIIPATNAHRVTMIPVIPTTLPPSVVTRGTARD
jgi:hypothetical protein